jgi:hypothetical protein
MNDQPYAEGSAGSRRLRNRDKPENTIMHHIIAAGNDLR